MPERCGKIIGLMEQIAPSYLAEKWDNVGLQIGEYNRNIHRVMVCLEVTNPIVDEAVLKNVDMIITHHPLIFKPLKSITDKDPIAKLVTRLIKENIALYCAHTNLDIVQGGTNDILAEKLNLINIKPLTLIDGQKYFKLVVFVPKSHIENVHKALCDGGAGHIGNYSHCTFMSEGIGTFKALDGANPFIGEVGEMEQVSEYKLETIVSDKNLKTVIKEMVQAHPYEEVAYDVVPLSNEIEPWGLGRVGYLNEPKNLAEFCDEIKNKLGMATIRFAGDKNKEIKRVGLCTGSGAGFIFDAFKAGCDCYVTGDVKYHEVQYALQLGINIIDAGHFETENIVSTVLVNELNKSIKENGYDMEVVLAEASLNPFQLI